MGPRPVSSAATAHPRSAPEIILHIGRNKAGSTTIQDFCLGARRELRSRGVEYALFGHLADSQPEVPGFTNFEALMAHVQAHPGLRCLISNEFMFGWPDAFTEAAAKELAGVDVQVIAYLRPYDTWLTSAYAEATRHGMNRRSIDDYLEWMWPYVSAWPHLRKWAECFGWERLRIAEFSRSALPGGDLIADFVDALGLEPIKWVQAPSNVAPHWLELELTRALTDRNADVEWEGAQRDEVEPLLALLKPLIREIEPVAYLTPDQRQRLQQLYDEDLARICDAGGPRLQSTPERVVSERRFRPAISEAPASLLRDFFAAATAPGFIAAHPAAAARAARLKGEFQTS
jgi:hypothetical protein